MILGLENAIYIHILYTMFTVQDTVCFLKHKIGFGQALVGQGLVGRIGLVIKNVSKKR